MNMLLSSRAVCIYLIVTRVIKGQGHIVNNYRSLCSLIVIHSVKLGEGMLPLRFLIRTHALR